MNLVPEDYGVFAIWIEGLPSIQEVVCRYRILRLFNAYDGVSLVFQFLYGTDCVIRMSPVNGELGSESGFVDFGSR